MKSVIIKLLTVISLSFLVFGCAALTNFVNSDNMAKLEGSYTSTLKVLNNFRAPCVDEDLTNDDECLIDDDLSRSINLYVQAGDIALDKAWEYKDNGDEEQFDFWVGIFVENINFLMDITNQIRRIGSN